MAYREENNPEVIDRILSLSKIRHKKLLIRGSRDMFKDPTFFLKDSRNDGILAFSLRGELGHRGTFWEGSFGTTEVQTGGNERYNAAESLKAATEAFKIAGEKWPGVPFSCAYGVTCPWIQELVIGKGPRGTDDYAAIDVTIRSFEAFGIRMVKLDPPQPKIFKSRDGRIELNLGLIYCHSVPLMIDRRKLDDSDVG